jgi:LPXTG-site transpeptidase (sortase) family protein
MRRIYNWTLVLGVILLVSGILSVLTIVWKNLPTSYDIVNEPGKNDIFLTTLAPADPVEASNILNPTPASLTAVIPDEVDSHASAVTDDDSQASTQKVLPALISEEEHSHARFSAPAETLNPAPPTVIPGGIAVPVNSAQADETLTSNLIFSPTVIPGGSYVTGIAAQTGEGQTPTPAATPTTPPGGNSTPTIPSAPVESQNLTPTAVTVLLPAGNSAPDSTNQASESLNPTPASPPTNLPAEDNPPASTPGSPSIGLIPERLVIPRINLDAQVVTIIYKGIEEEGQLYYQWLTPDQYAAGWHSTSALLGVKGNTVFNGHHNAYGRVFKDLVKLEVGDKVSIYSGSREFQYQVVASMLLPERFESLTTRMENARWIEPTSDERITLVTCWPEDSNTFRVIIVAIPI